MLPALHAAGRRNRPPTLAPPSRRHRRRFLSHHPNHHVMQRRHLPTTAGKGGGQGGGAASEQNSKASATHPLTPVSFLCLHFSSAEQTLAQRGNPLRTRVRQSGSRVELIVEISPVIFFRQERTGPGQRGPYSCDNANTKSIVCTCWIYDMYERCQ